jgi:hypothetical protein
MSTTAAIDENSVPTMIGVSETDGTTIDRVQVNPSNHTLIVDDNTTGTSHGDGTASRDENSHTVLIAVSSADGITPVQVYISSDGKLLVDST